MKGTRVSNGQLRLTRARYDEIVADLARPHTFARERVGFLFARRGTGANGEPLVLAVDYVPVADAHYEVCDDEDVGACIGVAAVRAVMQRVYDSGYGAWHVHRHDHQRRPRFSPDDAGTLPPLIQAFERAAPAQLHGALLLSRNCAMATTWPADQRRGVALASVSIVGYPLTIYRSR
jgi:hypothetical protein